MKRVLIIVALVMAAAVLGMVRSHGSVRNGLNFTLGESKDDNQGEVRDEIRKSFQLQPGALVEVRGINGSVEIQTSDTTTAEVYVLRTADSKESLDRREIIVEQTANGLVVRSQQSRNMGFFDHIFGHNPKEEVTIKAPRQIALALKGVNGRVSSGDIDGSLEVHGINGRVELGQAAGSAEMSGINGNVSVGFKQIDHGAELSGINGNIELRFAGTANADLTARGMNGRVLSDSADIVVDKDDHGSHFSARIGNGGPSITVHGINGNVRLTRQGASTGPNEKGETEKTKSSKLEVKGGV
jgi:hypothetical protein